MTRQTKTPRQLATVHLAAAQWRVDRLRTEHAEHQAAANRANAELAQAERLLAHAQDHPALRDTETGAGE